MWLLVLEYLLGLLFGDDADPQSRLIFHSRRIEASITASPPGPVSSPRTATEDRSKPEAAVAGPSTISTSGHR